MNSYSLESLESVPRKVRTRPGWVFGRWLAWAVLLGSLILGLSSANWSLSRLHRLQDKGELISADIIDRHEHQGKGTTYYLTVSFRQGEDSVTQEREVSSQTYHASVGESQISVTAMPENLHDFEVGPITDSTISKAQFRLILGLSFLYLLTGGLVLAIELCLRFEVNLLRDGVAITATVAYTKIVTNKTVATNVGYTYDTPLGQRNGMISVGGDVTSKYADGSGLIVLYNRNEDRRSRPIQSFTMVELVEPADG